MKSKEDILYDLGLGLDPTTDSFILQAMQEYADQESNRLERVVSLGVSQPVQTAGITLAGKAEITESEHQVYITDEGKEVVLIELCEWEGWLDQYYLGKRDSINE